MTRSNMSSLTSFTALWPFPISTGSWPSFFSIIERNSRIPFSSSTISILLISGASAHRQGYDEPGALTRVALHVYPPAMLLDHPVNYREAEPRAPLLGREEGVEYPVQFFMDDALPVVLDGYPDVPPAGLRRLHPDRAPVLRGLHRVYGE